jgi:hypothetical protein
MSASLRLAQQACGVSLLTVHIKFTTDLLDTHVRVGGAIGTEMLSRHCPKESGSVNPKCIGASMLMHMTPGSTGYLENTWLWVADHDLE